MVEELKEPATFHVKLQSDSEKQSGDEPGKSLIQEITMLRQQVQQLCQAVRSLVQLQSVANQKLDAVIKGSADCAVLCPTTLVSSPSVSSPAPE